MSAFIVSKSHIDSIISAGLAYGVEGLTKRSAMDEGRQLWEANILSVGVRYLGDPEALVIAGRIADVYVPRQVPVPSIAEAAKLVDCLEYQCVEHDGWPTSDAAAFLSKVREALLRNLEGYDAAAWGVAGAA
ncbi:hypothetical protein ASF49_08285 [Methylobacterium sp. Leaf104]|uniref:hypothetical protein n=1 Tax=Methylobacterium TaxID=407 RepID=UPI0006F386D8|nr:MULTISPECIES: hypothetical protein [Methylobacterium]KQP33854.1 hypothetical protein ASF49_08285 [Methylobacterium sp. Leaf104]MCI9879575.1 hypothetical protein [Methylobacterium goesingense]